MRYMLDTDICIYLIKRKPEHVLNKLYFHLDEGIGISAITLAELMIGVEASAYPEKNAIALNQFLAIVKILAFDDEAAAEYGKIRATLESRGTSIGPMDMLIAAHAKAKKLTLVTNNIREFEWVNDLDTDNWVNGC